MHGGELVWVIVTHVFVGPVLEVVVGADEEVVDDADEDEEGHACTSTGIKTAKVVASVENCISASFFFFPFLIIAKD